jgi:hemerythrin
MALLTWKDSFSVGNDDIDRQHKRLFETANQLHDSMLRGEGNAVLGSLLQNLVSYTRSHFAYEERLMEEVRYPHLQAHRADHEALTRQVMQIRDEYRGGRVALTLKVMTFLKEWLQGHILESDKRYSSHLLQRKR